jgi:hypothetical protein
MSVGLPPILILMLIYTWCSSSIWINKPYTKYIPTYPELVSHAMLFSCYHYFSIGNDVCYTWMQYEKAPPHEHTEKWRLKVGNTTTWNSSESDNCLFTFSARSYLNSHLVWPQDFESFYIIDLLAFKNRIFLAVFFSEIFLSNVFSWICISKL